MTRCTSSANIMLQKQSTEQQVVCTEPVAKLTKNEVQADHGTSTEHGKLATEYKESSTTKTDLRTEYNGKRTVYKGVTSEYDGLHSGYNVESTEYLG